jgi:hypothetical protein
MVMFSRFALEVSLFHTFRLLGKVLILDVPQLISCLFLSPLQNIPLALMLLNASPI